MIDPGKMDRRIVFEDMKPAGRDDTGQLQYTWDPIVNEDGVWAQVHSDGGNELFQSEKKTAERRRVFVTRYYKEVKETTSIVYMGMRYDIKALEEIGRREGLSIKATWTQGKYDE